MKKIGYLTGSAAILALPMFASAQATTNFTGDGGAVGTLLSNILTFTNTVLIPFIIGIGFLVFVWGMFQYFIAGGANDESKEKGKSLMIWATLGFVLIIVFWGVVNILTDASGIGGQTIASVPSVTTITTTGATSPTTPATPGP
jgi:uncharacterized membrane protein YidH (DUF202 family)